MVVFEVAQGSLKGWLPAEKAVDSQGLFLEIYSELLRGGEKRRVKCSCGCTGCCSIRAPDKNQRRAKSAVIPESRLMNWRKYNSDGFLIALFTMDCRVLNDSRVRRGDIMTIFADVFRMTLDDTPIFLGTLHTDWPAGFWGTACLRPSQECIEDGFQEDLELTLDVRPRSTRPFSLQLAKPNSTRATIQEMATLRKKTMVGHRASVASWGSRHERSNIAIPKNASSRIRAVHRGWLKLRRNKLDEELTNIDLESKAFGISFSGDYGTNSFQFSNIVSNENTMMSGERSTDSKRFRSEASGLCPASPKTPKHPFSLLSPKSHAVRSRSSQSPEVLPESSQHTASWAEAKTQASHKSLSFVESSIPTTKSAFLGDWHESGNSDDGGMVSAPSRPKRLSTRSNKSAYSVQSGKSRDPFQTIAEQALRLRVPNFFKSPVPSGQNPSGQSPSTGTKKENFEIQLSHWVPQDWQQFWKSVWPIASDELGELYEVTPIMEAEFRKDCLTFFNTLFPRVDCERFMLFRDLAFQRNSKMRFPEVKSRQRRASSKESLGSTGFGPVNSFSSRQSRLFVMMRRENMSTTVQRPSEVEDEMSDDSDQTVDFDSLASTGESRTENFMDTFSDSRRRRGQAKGRFRWLRFWRRAGRKKGQPSPFSSFYGGSSSRSMESRIFRRSLRSYNSSTSGHSGHSRRSHRLASPGNTDGANKTPTEDMAMSKVNSMDSKRMSVANAEQAWLDDMEDDVVPGERDDFNGATELGDVCEIMSGGKPSYTYSAATYTILSIDLEASSETGAAESACASRGYMKTKPSLKDPSANMLRAAADETEELVLVNPRACCLENLADDRKEVIIHEVGAHSARFFGQIRPHTGDITPTPNIHDKELDGTERRPKATIDPEEASEHYPASTASKCAVSIPSRDAGESPDLASPEISRALSLSSYRSRSVEFSCNSDDGPLQSRDDSRGSRGPEDSRGSSKKWKRPPREPGSPDDDVGIKTYAMRSQSLGSCSGDELEIPAKSTITLPAGQSGTSLGTGHERWDVTSECLSSKGSEIRHRRHSSECSVAETGSVSGRESVVSVPDRAVPKHKGAVISTVSREGCVFSDEYSPRIMAMKRLFLSFAFCGVYYTEVSNSAQLGELWPYPLATVLGHGSRILIRLEDVEGSEFLNFLLFGNPRCLDWRETGIPPPLKPRMAATHSVQIETETGHLIERRLKRNTMDTLQNIADGIRKRHLGINLPIGGVANPSALGPELFIDFMGRVMHKKTAPVKARQSSVARFVSAARNSRGSMASDERPSLRSSATSRSSGYHSQQPEEEQESWEPMARIQGGHLYVRVDEFGEQLSCWSNVFSGGAREDAAKDLLKKRDKDTVGIDLSICRAKMSKYKCSAGNLSFSSEVPVLKVNHALQYVADLDDHGGKSSTGIRLMRVSSDPCLTSLSVNAAPEDLTWVNQMIKCRKHVPLTIPPSESALEMLLHHYHPMNAQFFGTARYNTFHEFYTELIDQKSFLIKGDSSLERVVEPMILKLHWRNLVLLLTHEIKKQNTPPVRKCTFVCTRMCLGETWMQALRRALHKELNLRMEDLVKTLTSISLDARNCHRVIEETTRSPSYPGIQTFYRTHHIEWWIKEDSVDFYVEHGLPVDLEKRETAPCSCDFSTQKDTPAGVKTLYWKWVDAGTARTMQSFLNMGEDTPDERWAKYAFQQDGVLHPPPSDAALAILFKRCGIDTLKFGVDRYKSLDKLRLELLNQESYLMMSKGQLLRVAEDVLVRLRCKKRDIGIMDGGTWVVLVRTLDVTSPEGGEDQKKYALIRGRKDKEEAWQESAVACVAKDLCIARKQAKDLLEPGLKPGDASVNFYEEKQESPSYPGLETVYKTHLVTLTIRHDILSTTFQHLLFGTQASFTPAASVETGHTPYSSTVSRFTERVAISRHIQRTHTTYWDNEGLQLSDVVLNCSGGKDFIWMDEEDVWKTVGDASVWMEAITRQERRQISSVLLGLEGSAPQCRSPFGTTHDAKGTSSKISANGNCKWRAYRLNNALQIPASEGGIRMKIDRKTFEELMEACDTLDLLDPKMELVMERAQAWPRDLLDQRYAEKELFKKVLSGNGDEARKVVNWMVEYRRAHKSNARVYRDIASIPPRKLEPMPRDEAKGGTRSKSLLRVQRASCGPFRQ